MNAIMKTVKVNRMCRGLSACAFWGAVFFPVVLAAQSTGTLNLYPPADSPAVAEQKELNQVAGEANGSPVDMIRALEQHLRKYPESPRRSEIETSLYKTAVDLNDRPRIILYGEKLLAGKQGDEMEILDHVARALLYSDDAESAKRALAYAKRYEIAVDALGQRPPEGHTTAAQWADLADRARARATAVEARATGNLGNLDDAVAIARRSWMTYPTAEAAHEIARWLVKLGQEPEAIECYAEAVMIEDPRSPWSDRDRDRKTATALYVKIHGSDQGLGDLFLKGWDRSAAALRDHAARYKAMDRNYGQTDIFQFTLPAVRGDAVEPAAPELDMSTLKGKTVVIDFWATWCTPCIAQHPLLGHVIQKYSQGGDVVFLSLDADDDHSLVGPFLKGQNWDQRVYLESGLAGMLTVSSLPTILVIDPSGKIYSRMTGLSMDNFERLLGARIDEARALPAK